MSHVDLAAIPKQNPISVTLRPYFCLESGKHCYTRDNYRKPHVTRRQWGCSDTPTPGGGRGVHLNARAIPLHS
ncbi:hypothetical protein CEXT_543871 [Caerostris extrusa]|uniref:Uncharacterized protein n=1 Tax=Caerostris extrusa TaxID=172846 RepID=A0AAV4Y2H6_CAEEX|nr:hypothetical protein CEXT_543871 [Caerostris extrusa]